MGLPSGTPAPAKPRWLAWVVLVALVVIFLFFSPFLGQVSIPPSIVASILIYQFTGGLVGGSPCGAAAVSSARCDVLVEIVWNVRVPEVLLAFVVGAALGTSGATLQAIFRNPLADPYLLGLSSGAAFGAALLLVFNLGENAANLALPLFAFLGAFVTGLVVLLAARSPRTSVETLLLTGVALSAFLSSLLVLALVFNPIGSLQLSYWLLGGMSAATWGRVGIVFGGVLVTGAIIVLHARSLNILQLGPEVAQSLGVDSRRVVGRMVLLTSIATALAVAFAGVIGFVGLVAAHIVRRFFGSDYRLVLPISALGGALLLVGAFNVSQVLLPQTQVPVGVPLAFIGGPFFIYILYRVRARERGGTA